MNSKLTLQMDKDIIERAKLYARSKNQSLSSLVQDYFSYLSETKKPETIDLSPTVKELSGIIQLDRDIDIKEEHHKYLMEKYS